MRIDVAGEEAPLVRTALRAQLDETGRRIAGVKKRRRWSEAEREAELARLRRRTDALNRVLLALEEEE